MMLASMPADNRELIIICVVFAGMAAIFLPILFASIAEDRRLRRRMKERMEERERSRVELLRRIDEDVLRSQQAQIFQEVQRQIADQTVISLPVTHCERRERRRRFLPLEENTNEPR
jgi:uridine kinase